MWCWWWWRLQRQKKIRMLPIFIHMKIMDEISRFGQDRCQMSGSLSFEFYGIQNIQLNQLIIWTTCRHFLSFYFVTANACWALKQAALLFVWLTQWTFWIQLLWINSPHESYFFLLKNVINVSLCVFFHSYFEDFQRIYVE